MGKYIKKVSEFINEDLNAMQHIDDMVLRSYRLKFNPTTGLYDSDRYVKVGDDLVMDGKLIISFGTVNGYFSCDHLHLTTLEGCPREVGGDFYCQSNELTTLEGAPEKVGGTFICANNKLTSLKGAPQSVGGGFYCNINNLTTLEGCPREVGGDFECEQNNLISLEGAPEIVRGYFACKFNSTLKYDNEHFYALLPKVIKDGLIADDKKCDYELAKTYYNVVTESQINESNNDSYAIFEINRKVMVHSFNDDVRFANDELSINSTMNVIVTDNNQTIFEMPITTMMEVSVNTVDANNRTPLRIAEDYDFVIKDVRLVLDKVKKVIELTNEVVRDKIEWQLGKHITRVISNEGVMTSQEFDDMFYSDVHALLAAK